MRALADFIMRGRVQATLVVAGSAALPLLFWLSAAAGCLVLLRRGSDALSVLGIGLLSALVSWHFLKDPTTLLVLIGASSLALILRAGHTWNRVLLCSVAVGLLCAVSLGTVFSSIIESLAQTFKDVLPLAMGGVYETFSADQKAFVTAMTAPLMIISIASSLQIFSVLCLMLGRYWQASLYNPGGFGREFRAVRFPKGVALSLLAVMCVAPFFGLHALILLPLCSVPLIFAGLALVHGLVAQKRLASFWLVGMYVTLFPFMHLLGPLLVVLAIVDSLIDFRGRMASKDADNANGEG
ncbi:membrane protein [Pseudomonas chlororaphis]|uniref:Membrane protein n=1 Tax=Pseudomonas chlororaphis TaxID=587753 RepID=A0A0G3GAD5_9PSED|nr:membrane protein [Pseudomonas chlororaphis]